VAVRKAVAKAPIKRKPKPRVKRKRVTISFDLDENLCMMRSNSTPFWRSSVTTDTATPRQRTSTF
jgi:hypothetical protein